MSIFENPYVKAVLKLRDKENIFLYEGDKVKLDYEKIIKDANYNKKTERYKKFIEENKNNIFTVEYDVLHIKKPMLVCLKEDKSIIKWLFWIGHLKKV